MNELDFDTRVELLTIELAEIAKIIEELNERIKALAENND